MAFTVLKLNIDLPVGNHLRILKDFIKIIPMALLNSIILYGRIL